MKELQLRVDPAEQFQAVEKLFCGHYYEGLSLFCILVSYPRLIPINYIKMCYCVVAIGLQCRQLEIHECAHKAAESISE